MQTELEYTARFMSLDLLWDSEEASVNIFNLAESRWD